MIDQSFVIVFLSTEVNTHQFALTFTLWQHTWPFTYLQLTLFFQQCLIHSTFTPADFLFEYFLLWHNVPTPKFESKCTNALLTWTLFRHYTSILTSNGIAPLHLQFVLFLPSLNLELTLLSKLCEVDKLFALLVAAPVIWNGFSFQLLLIYPVCVSALGTFHTYWCLVTSLTKLISESHNAVYQWLLPKSTTFENMHPNKLMIINHVNPNPSCPISPSDILSWQLPFIISNELLCFVWLSWWLGAP